MIRSGVAATVLAVLVGCGTAADTTTPVPTTTLAATSTTAPRPSALGFSDGDTGRTVDVPVGRRVTVILHSSDFVFAPPSDPSVVRQDGSPTVTPGGPPCVEVPGSGCGTVVASFVAVAPGDAELQAERPNCAEPTCAPADATWTLLVHVPGAAVPNTTATGTGEVRGTVLFSPVCPVERDPPDPACAPRPGPAQIELVDADGTPAATVAAGDDGTFAVTVAPGSYIVQASTAGPGAGIGGGCQAEPPEVTVQAGSSTTVAVSCDTGIR